MMKKRYIIFDFDGTLVNTNDIIIESWQETLRKYLGHELPVRTIEATFGEVLADSIANLIPDADVDEAVKCYRDYQDSHHEEIRVYVYDGIRELLNELRKQGCLIGVGTSRTAYSFWNYMKELEMEGYVDEVVTMNDVTNHKPHPETVEAALIKLMAHDDSSISHAGSDNLAAVKASDPGICPDHTQRAGTGSGIPQSVLDAAVMIGDTKYDVGCAQNAGVDSVLIGWSHYIDEDSMAADGFAPTYRIQKPAELLDIVSGAK